MLPYTAPEVSPPGARSAWFRFLFCCWLAIFGVRAFCVYHFAASVAMVDEWEATGQQTLAAWHNGTYTWAALFQAHNGDHRIVATRLWEILWFELNGAWDPKLMMVVKCLIFAAAGVLFTNMLSRNLGARRFLAAGLFSALFAFPFGYQNLLWGFQSQFDFFLLAAALGWTALLAGRPVLALIIAALSPFTLGAGAIIAASYLFYAAAMWWRAGWTLKRAAAFGAVSFVVMVFAASLRSSEAAPLGAPADQAYTFVKLLAWPYSNLLLLVWQWPESARLIPNAAANFPSHDHSVLIGLAHTFQAHPATLIGLMSAIALLVLAPLGAAVWDLIDRRRSCSLVFGALCLGAFALLLQVASAIARSSEVMVQTRYLDVVALTGFASVAAAIALAIERPQWRRALLVWAVVLTPGYLATMGASVIQMKHSKHREWVAAVREYFPSHDRSKLPLNEHWQLPILEKDPTAFENLLDDPATDAVLPLSIVDPAKDPRPLASAAFVVARFGGLLSLAAALAACYEAARARRRVIGVAEVPMAEGARI